jgi:hypothetical protein
MALGGLFYLIRGHIFLNLGRLWISGFPAAALLVAGLVLVLTARWRLHP